MIASISWWLLHLACKWQPSWELKGDMQIKANTKKFFFMEEKRETEIEKTT